MSDETIGDSLDGKYADGMALTSYNCMVCGKPCSQCGCLDEKMLVFEIVGEPVYGSTVQIPFGYDWAKGDPPKSTVGGIPVYDRTGHPFDFNRPNGMWYTEELLADAGIKVKKEPAHVR